MCEKTKFAICDKTEFAMGECIRCEAKSSHPTQRSLAWIGILAAAFLVGSLGALWPDKLAAQEEPAITPAPKRGSSTTRRSGLSSGINLNPTPFSVNRLGMSREEKTSGSAARRKTTKASTSGAGANAIQPKAEGQGATKDAPSHGVAGTSISGSSAPPSIRYPPDALAAVLRFSPADVITHLGDVCEISAALDNPQRQPVESFQFAVEYDPLWLSFLNFEEDTGTHLISPGKDGLHISRQPGRLEVEGTFEKPVSDENIRIIKLRFATRETQGRTLLRLAPVSGGQAPAAMSQGENILLSDNAALRGVVGANVFIRPRKEKPDIEDLLLQAGPADSASESKLKGWPIAPSDAKTEAPVALRLQAPAKTTIPAGKDFWVDLVLYNDELAPIDSIGAAIQFDPKALQVIDEDQGNPITRGVNIWDGGFRVDYPFDVFRANQADNRTGIILYSMGRYQSSHPFPTGIFARIHFRAIMPADITAIRLIRSEKPGLPLTFIRTYGVDRLALLEPSQPLHSIRLRIMAQLEQPGRQ